MAVGMTLGMGSSSDSDDDEAYKLFLQRARAHPAPTEPHKCVSCCKTFKPPTMYDSPCVDKFTGKLRGCTLALCPLCLCDSVTASMSDQVIRRLSHRFDFPKALEGSMGSIADGCNDDDKEVVEIPCSVCTRSGIRLMDCRNKFKTAYHCMHDGCPFFMNVLTAEDARGMIELIAPAAKREELTDELTDCLPKHEDIKSAMRQHEKRCPHDPMNKLVLGDDTFASRALREAKRTQTIVEVKNAEVSNELTKKDATIRRLKRRISEVETERDAARLRFDAPFESDSQDSH